MKLPDDPQERNNERAHWAQVTLAAFVAETSTDENTALTQCPMGLQSDLIFPIMPPSHVLG
jgi:hypothetical protein